MWQEFLAAKFTPTELEMARSALEKLSESSDEKDEITRITREEFDNAVNNMKKAKASGPDGIPAEVWQNSAVAATRTTVRSNSCRKFGTKKRCQQI